MTTELTEKQLAVLQLTMDGLRYERGGVALRRDVEYNQIAQELVGLGMLVEGVSGSDHIAYYAITDAGAAHLWTPLEAELAQAGVGDRVRFAEEKRAYTIRARGSRYLICTKPFNLQTTVLYTVVDLRERVRGTENLIFCMGAETQEQCEEMLARLEGRAEYRLCATEVSHRNRINLDVVEVLPAKAGAR